LKPQYLHLDPTTRDIAVEDAESRIRRIRSDRWISYPRAERALAECEELLNFPKRIRMPNLLVVGPTNNGKSAIIERFRRTHPPIEPSKTLDGIAHVPVLKVQMPAGPDERRFFGAILDALGFPGMPSDSVTKRQDSAVRMLHAAGVTCLAIDEVHNLLSGSALQQRRILNLLRWLGNELQIPLIAVGTAEALHAIHSDDQLANRFEPLGLPPWQDDEEFRNLLGTLEAVLPLRRRSDLAKAELARRILCASEGILGEIVAIVTRAAVRAVSTGAERISAKIIEDCGFTSPSQRRHVEV
jgi:Bacterial TniB protein